VGQLKEIQTKTAKALAHAGVASKDDNLMGVTEKLRWKMRNELSSLFGRLSHVAIGVALPRVPKLRAPHARRCSVVLVPIEGILLLRLGIS